jgi:hypothetical protein
VAALIMYATSVLSAPWQAAVMVGIALVSIAPLATRAGRQRLASQAREPLWRVLSAPASMVLLGLYVVWPRLWLGVVAFGLIAAPFLVDAWKHRERLHDGRGGTWMT